MNTKSLAGKRVGLTGTDDFRGKVRRALAGTGAVCLDLTRAAPLPTDAPIPWQAIRAAQKPILVFTSGQGVRVFFAENIPNDALRGCRFAAIGQATARVLAEHGFPPELVPETATSEALAELLLARADGGAVFTMVSRRGSDTVEERLRPAGIPVTRTDIYDVEYRCEAVSPAPDFYVFGSAGAVRALYEGGIPIVPGARCVCIGPVCGGALRELYGLEPLPAEGISVEGIARTLTRYA